MKVTTFLLSLIVLALFIPRDLHAQDTVTHTIQKGETLFGIARQYDTEVQQLRRWNDLKADELSVGQSIIVGKEGEASPASGTGETQQHTVEKGETLFSVSKQYQVTIAELKAWNNLTANNLKVGQTLTIHPSESTEPQEEPITVENTAQQNTTYLVKNNDSLYGIAQKHGMSVAQLKKLNNLSSNTIRVGQELTVRSSSSTPSVASSSTSSTAPQGRFIKHRISGGTTTVAQLAKKFHMDEEEFRALNTDIQSDRLRNGQEVTVLTPSSKSFKNPYIKNSSSMSSLGTVTISQYDASDKATPTTSGDLYNPEALTGAHPNIALGSIIFVKNPQYPHGVFVRINDRISGKGLKLSTAAWNTLHFAGSSASAMIYQD
ncbi:LysM peptidoglycan-binding domain-containing protein [Fodinibius sediminis]|uniref:LysM repeat-containing protein n=1 Tax=Fodinibius sediminis TaxID=1214077 RepID=A0A521AHI5_9BACT|nr:LysM peptidoglycan-binding domain-containing protein [Fodinibius sediminis]SMO34243.1 LysM repeat-containing protein [Fodinibius sediminis]